jgi:MFS family permease
LLLALAYFCLVNTLNANGSWIPTIVREVLKAYSLSQVGFITAIPALAALVLMPLWNRSSDRMHRQFFRRAVLRHGAAGGFDRAGIDRFAASSDCGVNVVAWLIRVWKSSPSVRRSPDP